MKIKKEKPRKEQDEELRRAKNSLKTMAGIAGATIAFMTFYFVSAELVERGYSGFSVTFWVYFAVLFIALIAYVIWNHGFTRGNVTPDMLPDTWSAVEKQKFFDEAAKWKEDSKFLLFIIIPIVFTFLIDAVKLMIIDRWF